MPSPSPSASSPPHLSHYPSNINSKPKTSTKCKTNTIQTKKKKPKIVMSTVRSVRWFGREWWWGGTGEGERKREEERTGRKSTYSGRIFLCIPTTDPAERGFQLDPAGSIKPTYAHRRRFDRLCRIQPKTVARSRRASHSCRLSKCRRCPSSIVGWREEEERREL